MSSIDGVVESVMMRFAEVEALVGPLPPSAPKHPEWWANDSKVEAVAWRSAGADLPVGAGAQLVRPSGAKAMLTRDERPYYEIGIGLPDVAT